MLNKQKILIKGTFLAKGTLRQMNYKAEKYKNNKSLVTTDSEYSGSKIRKRN
jgi:hypothetical protein